MAAVGNDDILEHVLIIDLSDFQTRKSDIAQQLHHAASSVGFFYVKGHGIPGEDIDRFFASGQRFVELEDVKKSKYGFIPDRYTGWRSQTDLELVTGNRLWEWFGFGRYGLGGYDARNQEFLGERWPEELGEHWKQQALDFLAQTHGVAAKILRAMAISLGRDEHFFDESIEFDHEENGSFMGINWYPDVPAESKRFPPRLHAHSDMGLVTMLFQRPGDTGLEIAPEIDRNPALDKIGSVWNTVPTAKHWAPLDPIEGAITVNCGDGLSWWTDGWKAVSQHPYILNTA